MKISSLPQINQINIKRKNDEQVRNNSLSQDSFVKSNNVSFGSAPWENLLDGLFDTLAKSITDAFISSLGTVLEHQTKEVHMKALIEVMSEKRNKNIFARDRNLKIENFLYNFGKFEALVPIFKEAQINTMWHLENFLRVYNQSNFAKQAFKGQEIEAVQIYGLLDAKSDFANYPDLLLYLFNDEHNKDNPDLNKLNQYTTLLKNLGVTKFVDFKEKYKHLSSAFNDFESIQDQVNAITYLQRTLDDKLTYLKELSKSNPSVGKDVAKIYASIPDVIDYFYVMNSGENLSGIEDILDIVSMQNKFKASSLKLFSSEMNEFSTIEDKISFYRFMKRSDVSIDDFNSISKKSFIEPNDILNQLHNKKFFCETIAELKEVSDTNASELYKKFADVVFAVYDEETGSTENIKTLINVIDTFKLKSSTDILNLYNSFTRDKKRTLSDKEVTDFIELFNYSDFSNINVQAKNKKVAPIEILKQEREKFLAVQGEIKTFVSSDKNGYFAGESELDIYKKYYDLLQHPTTSVSSILENIANFNIIDSEQYRQKSEALADFEIFFEDRASTLKFISENEISLDEDEKVYKENCLSVLNALNDSSKEEIDYFISSNFFLKSKNKLNEFIEKTQNKELRKEILTIIADKKIPSLTHLTKFFTQYSNDDLSAKKLLEYLKNLPEDIDFNKSIEIVRNIQSKLNELSIPLLINANIMQEIEIDRFMNGEEISTSQISSLMNRIHHAKENENFLSVLSVSPNNDTQRFQAHHIAQELVFKSQIAKDSYQNIFRLLGLDKASLGLDENVSDYIYINAIKSVLPEDFVDFVNSNEWVKYNPENETTPNIVLHARLRAIERFALNNADDISTLYTEETKTKLLNLFRTVYTQEPTEIRGTSKTKRYVVDHIFESNVIEAVFSNVGEMITIVPKSK